MPPMNPQTPSKPPNGRPPEVSLTGAARQDDFESVDVVYKAEWYHRVSGRRRVVEISSPSDLKITAKTVKPAKIDKVPKPVLEAITTIVATDRTTTFTAQAEEVRGHSGSNSHSISKLESVATSSSDSDTGSNSDTITRIRRRAVARSHKRPDRALRASHDPDSVLAPLAGSLDDVEIAEIGKTRLVIHSPTLLNAIRRAIDYYPAQDLTGESVTIKEPYMCLVHHYDTLKKCALPCEDGGPVQGCKLHSHSSICDVETKAHVQILLDFLQPFMESSIQPALEKLRRQVPVITFDMVWLLFQPGTDICEDFQEDAPPAGGFRFASVLASVVRNVEYTTTRSTDRDDKGVATWEVWSWFMCTNGEDIGRCDSKNHIYHFEGEKEVAQLPFFPSRYTDASWKAKLTDRGRMANELLKRRNKAVFFDGSVFTANGKAARKYRGRAIIDPQSTAKYTRTDKLISWNPTPSVIEDRSPHLIELGMKTNKYSDYDSLTTASNLTDHQHSLMFPFIGGFGLDDKEWKFFHTGGIQDAPYDRKALKKLVLEDSDVKIIKAISYRQALGHKSSNMDFIEGKGQGQVILLHGPPGVGKTYTVESIAAYFERPLLSLSIADIGTKEESVDGALTRWLKLAEIWNAVLLIDEADVFLERRSRNNVERNGLVSVFLRKMEYFQGLLFLTTNRLGQLDDAFASRIHAKIHYPCLKDHQRSKIWEAFFEKLRNESEERIFVAKTAKEYVLNHKDVKARHWNGREIRNAFQTAIALAEFEASEDDGRPKGAPVEVKNEHFRQVMEMSQKFSDYVDGLEGRNENERAKARTERDDELSSDGGS